MKKIITLNLKSSPVFTIARQNHHYRISPVKQSCQCKYVQLHVFPLISKQHSIHFKLTYRFIFDSPLSFTTCLWYIAFTGWELKPITFLLFKNLCNMLYDDNVRCALWKHLIAWLQSIFTPGITGRSSDLMTHVNLRLSEQSAPCIPSII